MRSHLKKAFGWPQTRRPALQMSKAINAFNPYSNFPKRHLPEPVCFCLGHPLANVISFLLVVCGKCNCLQSPIFDLLQWRPGKSHSMRDSHDTNFSCSYRYPSLWVTSLPLIRLCPLLSIPEKVKIGFCFARDRQNFRDSPAEVLIRVGLHLTSNARLTGYYLL